VISDVTLPYVGLRWRPAPLEVISLAVCRYLRYGLSCRDAEELLAGHQHSPMTAIHFREPVEIPLQNSSTRQLPSRQTSACAEYTPRSASRYNSTPGQMHDGLSHGKEKHNGGRLARAAPERLICAHAPENSRLS